MLIKICILLALLSYSIEGKPTKHVKECVQNSDCAEGFGCIMAKKFGKLICAKRKTTDLDYTNQQDYDGDDYVDKEGTKF